MNERYIELSSPSPFHRRMTRYTYRHLHCKFSFVDMAIAVDGSWRNWPCNCKLFMYLQFLISDVIVHAKHIQY